MKYSTIIRSKLSITINKQFSNYIIRRCASNGLGLWHLNCTNEVRLKIEDYWKDKLWSRRLTIDESDDNQDKYYVLSMFPYPSGSLHMGHVRVYAISDSVSRFHRMRGKSVIHPMGWDAFGLPAENAAREHNVDPKEWTDANIKSMKSQLQVLGCDFDWDREIATCDPSYYRWTQELFLKLYDRDLVYQKEAFVNWDPIDKTVLADEQVGEDGRSWRSNAKIEKKLLKQWFIRTTAFAKSLMDGLADPMLIEWRDIIKIQKHWIGECSGISIDFQLICDLQEKPQTINLWTNHPELIEHAKFVAVSKDNFIAKARIKNFEEESTQYLNAKVINPFNNEELPIYYTDSLEFLPLRDNHLGIPCRSDTDADFCASVGINFQPLDHLSDDEADHKRHKIMRIAQEKRIGGYPVSPSLRDWLISRQRYWGTPIPIIHCSSCGTQPVPRDQLPVILPKITGDATRIRNLHDVVDWLKTPCPKCGNEAVREADTMDTFVDSSWYFMRYVDPKNDKEIFSADKVNKHLPVDLYIGGKEHAALHLYYARFINHFLHSEGLLPTREPFKQLLVQGMVMGKSYRVKDTGKYLKPNEVDKSGKHFFEKDTKLPVITKWEKMSKSKYNGVDPMDMFNEYGCDTTRLIILADFSPTSSRNWSDATFSGILNWQQRLWLTIRQFLESRKKILEIDPKKIYDFESVKDDNDSMYKSRNYYVNGVTFNIIGSQQLSVGISKMQGLTNSLRKVALKSLKSSIEYERALAAQIIMLAPLAPRFASELWSGYCSAPYFLIDNDPYIQRDKDVLEQKWPEVDMDYELKCNIHVNGYLTDVFKVPRRTIEELSAEQTLDYALRSQKVQKLMETRNIIDFKLYSIPGCDKKIFIKTTEPIKSSLKVEENA